MKALALLALLALPAACAPTARPAPHDPETVTLRVTNESRARLMVYLSRGTSTPERLGTVDAFATRSFAVTRATVAHTRLRLHSVPVRATPGADEVYGTLPFGVSGAQEVEWVIRDGQPAWKVDLHPVRR